MLIAIELIFAAIIGVLLGNYASTALFRLPKQIPLSGYNPNTGKAPHCSSCSHPLRFYEYFPVLSWIFSRGKCNYCGAKVDPAYFGLEFSGMVLSVLLLIAFNYHFSEEYILILFASMTLVLALFMAERSIEHTGYVLILFAFLGMIYRTLLDHSIQPWIISFIVSYFVYVSITRKDNISDEQQTFAFSIITAGIWFPFAKFILAAIFFYAIHFSKLSNPQKLKNMLFVILIFLFTLTNSKAIISSL